VILPALGDRAYQIGFRLDHHWAVLDQESGV